MTDGSYVVLCARQLRDGVVPLLLATLLGLVVAAPWLATIALGAEALAPLLCALFGAPAWAGLVRVAALGARGEAGSAKEALLGIRDRYLEAAALGAATGGFAWAFESALGAAGSGGPMAVATLALATGGLIVVLIVDVYAFPLLVLARTSLRGAMRAALGLAARGVGATVAMVAAGALALLAAAWLGPGTLLMSLPTLAVLHVNNALLQLGRAAAR
jgi:uncharacterized membrane protein YesL